MNRVAKFYKVSFEQFMKDYGDTFWDKKSDFTIEEIQKIREVYDRIKLPKRATNTRRRCFYHGRCRLSG